MQRHHPVTALTKVTRLLAAILAVAAWLLAESAAARAQQDYMACDNAHAPDYPFVWAHPSGCDLGLGQSMYQSQPVHGRSFASLGLRRLHWKRWARYEATARGLSCDVRSNGSVIRATCDHVEVNVYHPVKIGPAGFTPIYQRVRVLHRRSRREPYRYGYWYQPGLDY